MVDIKAKARHQRKVPKGKGVRKSKREKKMVETKAKARRPRKVTKRKGVRKTKREKENGRDQGEG
jgi:hypothetical protein